MLHVLGRCADGFHDLQSLITFLDKGDMLTLAPASRFSLEITGPFAQELSGTPDNLISKAVRFMESYFQRQSTHQLTLHKNLPVGSGLGGGSSDAATTIVALLRDWEIFLDEAETAALIKAVGALGADVPVCLAYHLLGKNFFWLEGTGREGIFTPFTLTGPYYILLVNPGLPVATPAVFKKLELPYDPPLTFQNNDLLSFLGATHNRLTTPAISVCPAIQKILALLETQKGCLLARLSGSGATCFGLFHNENDVERAAKEIKKCQPQIWIETSKII